MCVVVSAVPLLSVCVWWSLLTLFPSAFFGGNWKLLTSGMHCCSCTCAEKSNVTMVAGSARYLLPQYLLVELPELGISPVHIPFLVPDPDKHLVNVVCIGTTPPFYHRRNPHVDESSGIGLTDGH